ncbi:vacuolar protein sorting-associated protein 70 [Coprinopsis sp. MPI-PUGE-AT-0042]|nr:vacuolar protein sorting-associated protein 70 [Coprinopsis sp. MPI-PUGE-AT-0042]
MAPKSLKEPGIPLPSVGSRTKTQQPCQWKRLGLFAVSALTVGCLFLTYAPGHHGFHPRKPPPRLNATEAEQLFLTVPDPKRALEASRSYATQPHLAGSSQDFEDAKVILKLFQDELGIHKPHKEPIYKAGSHASRHSTLQLTGWFGPRHPTAWIDTYYPVLNTPLDRAVEILESDGTASWSADLVEDGDPLDPEAAYFGGNATGNLIYANYGLQEDYKALLAQGVNFTGKIVLTRYGGIFRGLKIKGAQELGAAGVLIYSDPRDDGYVTEDNGYLPYPHGPARNPTSVQRGSVQYLSLYPGDPTTPGFPAYENVKREEGVNIPKIPSLPISWANAKVLLNELKEEETEDPRELPGRVSKRQVKIVNNVDNKVTPIWNTMAAIPGHIKDEVVILGCHRDAWVMGAADPTSGTVSLHEIIRGFGELLRKGWKPLRTIVIASWDAEEYGLVGSTEWGEDFERWLSDHVVAYLNVDVSVSGSRWNVGGSPSLANLIKKTAQDVPHPLIPGKTLWDAREDQGPYSGNKTSPKIDLDFLETWERAENQRKAEDTGISPLGSGSDYTVFLQRIGIASSDEGFGGTPTDAVYHYHSVYDSQRWQEVYADPDFTKHVAVAKHLGLLGLRIIDSIVLPLNTTQYSLELEDYLDRVEAITPSGAGYDFSRLRASIKSLQHASIELDSEKVEAEKKFRDILEKMPRRRFSRLHVAARQAWHRVKNAAQRFVFSLTGIEISKQRHGCMGRQNHALHSQEGPQKGRCKGLRRLHWEGPEGILGIANTMDDSEVEHCPFPIREFIKAAKRVGKANKKLIGFERGFISEGGIEDREWYKHLGVAPGKWLGYGATTFPALTEAITENKGEKQVEHEVGRLVELIDKLAERIRP